MRSGVPNALRAPDADGGNMRSRKQRQVDPFNAPDPSMPWERSPEYVPIGSDEPEGTVFSNGGQVEGDEHECWVDDEAGSKKSTGAKPVKNRPSGGRKGRGTTPAPQAKAGDGWASPDPSATRQAGEGARPERHAEKKGRAKGSRGGCLLAIIVIVALVSIVSGATTCAVNLFVGDGGEQASTDYTHDEPASPDFPGLDESTQRSVGDQIEGQANQQFKDFSERMTSGDAQLVSRAAADLEATFKESSGSSLTPADMGIDTTELARWSLAKTRLQVGGDRDLHSFAFSEDADDTRWSGSTYGDLFVPDANNVMWQTSYYVRSDLLKYSDRALTPSELELAKKKLEELKAQAEAAPVEHYISIDFTATCDADGSNPEVTFADDAFTNEFDSFFGVYHTS